MYDENPPGLDPNKARLIIWGMFLVTVILLILWYNRWWPFQ